MPSLSEMAPGSELSGVIVRGYGLYFDVATGVGLLRCTLRGALKRARRGTDPAAVGDRVRATLTTPETDPPEGVIEEILPRERTLSRLARGTNDVEQVIVANPDQLVAVFAIHEPEPHPRLVDRFLKFAWLNPEPEDRWDYTPSVKITRDLVEQRMFPLTLEGIDRAMRALNA
ncbi:MAG TPA: hypothetical protein PKA95_06815, partial [Thermomicrobiales bacterium]|nr:hypothetical protein [Thermomicrobiales bacterium]